jgi:hypothetical protein
MFLCSSVKGCCYKNAIYTLFKEYVDIVNIIESNQLDYATEKDNDIYFNDLHNFNKNDYAVFIFTSDDLLSNSLYLNNKFRYEFECMKSKVDINNIFIITPKLGSVNFEISENNILEYSDETINNNDFENNISRLVISNPASILLTAISKNLKLNNKKLLDIARNRKNIDNWIEKTNKPL